MYHPNRRELLLGLAAGAAVVPGIGLAGSDAAAVARSPILAADGRLTVNRERAHRLMREAGLDAIVGASALNSRYLANMRSILAGFGPRHSLIGVMPADPSKPLIAIVAGSFDIPRNLGPSREWPEIVTYGSAANADEFAGRSRLAIGEAVEAREPVARTATGDGVLTPLESAWLDASSKLPTFTAASPELALRRVLTDLGLARGRIGIDEADVSNALVRTGWDPQRLVDAGNLFLKLRMVKSGVEIERMRTAALLNAESARAMFRSLQVGMNSDEVQALFFSELVQRGGLPGSVSIGMVSGLRHGVLVRNEPMLVDCVGEFNGYCGDFGRTLVFGTPSTKLEQRVAVMRRLVPATFELVKPGVRYSDLRRDTAAIVKKMGANFRVGVGPHSVGMQHTDDAWRDDLPFYAGADTLLEAGMTITLDMPTIEPGWGSTHMESLILVTNDGAEWLDAYDDPLCELDA